MLIFRLDIVHRVSLWASTALVSQQEVVVCFNGKRIVFSVNLCNVWVTSWTPSWKVCWLISPWVCNRLLIFLSDIFRRTVVFRFSTSDSAPHVCRECTGKRSPFPSQTLHFVAELTAAMLKMNCSSYQPVICIYRLSFPSSAIWSVSDCHMTVSCSWLLSFLAFKVTVLFSLCDSLWICKRRRDLGKFSSLYSFDLWKRTHYLLRHIASCS